MDSLMSKFWGALERHLGVSLFRVMERPLRRDAPVAHPLARLRLMTEADVLPLCADPELELDPLKVSAAFARGDTCIGAFVEGRLVAYQWVAFGDAPHVANLWLTFAPGARYTYKGFVRPAYRGHRIHPAMNVFIDSMCIDRGLERATSLVGIANESSVRASMRSGNRIVGYVGFIRLPWRTFFIQSPGARHRGMRFFAKQAPLRQKVYRSEWQRQRRLRH